MKKIMKTVLLLGLFALLGLTLFKPSSVVTATGWVKLHPASTQSHNAYSVKSGIGTFGGFTATNVKTGDKAGDDSIPDGEYYVTFWVTGRTGSGRAVTDVEHKKKMKFVGGKMQGEIRLTVALGTITSAGVSYPE